MRKNGLLFFGRAELIVVLIMIAGIGLTISLWAFLPSRSARAQKGRNSIPSQSDLSSTTSLTTSSIQTGQRSAPSHDSLERSANYVGPPAHEPYSPKEKWPAGTVIDLNAADSTALLKVPGIGPAFAGRIIRYRQRLGGYYTVLQLQEVFGMDYSRYQGLKRWFAIHSSVQPVRMDSLRYGHLPRHPYLSWKQRGAIDKILRREGKVSRWSQLMALPEFTTEDSIRLSHYFQFDS